MIERPCEHKQVIHNFNFVGVGNAHSIVDMAQTMVECIRGTNDEYSLSEQCCALETVKLYIKHWVSDGDTDEYDRQVLALLKAAVVMAGPIIISQANDACEAFFPA